MMELAMWALFIGPGLLIMVSGHPWIALVVLIASPSAILTGTPGAIVLWTTAVFLYRTRPR